MNAKTLKITKNDIAAAIDAQPSKVRDDARNGIFDFDDLWSVVRYVYLERETKGMRSGLHSQHTGR